MRGEYYPDSSKSWTTAKSLGSSTGSQAWEPNCTENQTCPLPIVCSLCGEGPGEWVSLLLQSLPEALPETVNTQMCFLPPFIIKSTALTSETLFNICSAIQSAVMSALSCFWAKRAQVWEDKWKLVWCISACGWDWWNLATYECMTLQKVCVTFTWDPEPICTQLNIAD